MQEPTASQEIYRGKIVTLRVDTVPTPIGGTQQFEVVEHADGVAVVAVRFNKRTGDEPEVVLVRQRRPAVQRELWEIPAGVLDAQDRGAPERAASRELREETGYSASVWRLLVRQLPSPGFSTERIFIYLATGVHPATGAASGTPEDASEIDAVRWVPLSEALRWCQSGEIEDGKTILGLHLAQEALATSDARGGAAIMPRDALNMPMARDAAFRVDEAAPAAPAPPSAPAENGTGLSLDAQLKLETMLLEEYNYASVTAYQALEDRARMFNLYLLLIGVVGSALGALFQFAKPNESDPVGLHSIEWLVIVLLAVGGILGIAFFMKLLRLRAAYRGSLIAMNVIKEYYIRHFKDTVRDVESAFFWRLGTIPAGESRGTVTYVVCYTVAFLGSLCFASAAFVGAQLALDIYASDMVVWRTLIPLVVACGVLGLSLLLHTVYYRHKLNKRAEAEFLAKIGSEVEHGVAPTA